LHGWGFCAGSQRRRHGGKESEEWEKFTHGSSLRAHGGLRSEKAAVELPYSWVLRKKIAPEAAGPFRG
jgi:hypothetical protein